MVNKHVFPEKGILLFGVGAWRGEVAPDKDTALECPQIGREFPEGAADVQLHLCA
jgi:hypothetical protein